MNSVAINKSYLGDFAKTHSSEPGQSASSLSGHNQRHRLLHSFTLPIIDLIILTILITTLKLLTAQRQAQYISRLSQLREDLLREEDVRFSQSLNRLREQFSNRGSTKRVIEKNRYPKESLTEKRTKVTNVQCSKQHGLKEEFPYQGVSLNGRKLLEPIRNDNQSDNKHNKRKVSMDLRRLNETKRLSLGSEKVEVHGMNYKHKSRSLENHGNGETRYRNPRNSPVQFMPDLSASFTQRQHSHSSPNISSYWLDTPRSGPQYSYYGAHSNYLRKPMYQSPRNRTASSSHESIFLLGSKGISLHKDKLKSDKKMTSMVTKDFENKRSGDSIYLPCIKVNRESLPPFVVRKQNEHVNKGEREHVKDEESFHTSYRLPKRIFPAYETIPVVFHRTALLKKIEISIPSVEFENSDVFDTRLPSAEYKAYNQNIHNKTSIQTNVIEPIQPELNGFIGSNIHHQHDLPIDKTNHKKSVIVKIPRIDFHPSSPELLKRCEAVQGNLSKPKLTLSRTESQKKLREKELRNLFEDVKELTDLANSLKNSIKQREYLF